MAKTLIVDDYALSRTLFRLRLSEIGCEIVAEAATVAEAREALARNKFDLVILDVIMPSDGEVDTLELFSQIRRNSPRTKVVVVSGVNNPRFADAYLRFGAIDYFLKPVDFHALSSRLQRNFPHLTEIPQHKPPASDATSPRPFLEPVTLPGRPSASRGVLRFSELKRNAESRSVGSTAPEWPDKNIVPRAKPK